jgi:uncharacterized protein
LLLAGRDKQQNLFTSTPLLAELTDILSRRKFAKKLAASGLTVEQIVDRYAELATLVRPVTIAPTILNDPDDDHVLACAIAARADLIVSGDKHLHGLGGEYQGIRIVTPAQAVSIVTAG